MNREHSGMQQATDEVIHAVSLIVESKDPYTAAHQRRVAELAQAIAEEIGFPEWWAIGIYIAGLLHDIGKVAVPTVILNKPGRLSEYELSLMREHPRVGYEILEKIQFPWPVARAILQHHERLDGSGYPEGLSGEDIIPEARILSVADVVDAIFSQRPYRPALGLEVALGEVSSKKGILYDSRVAEACLRLLGTDKLAFERIMAVADRSGCARG